MNIYEKIFRAFSKAKIRYLIVGGVAVNLYGYIRYTDDIDILLAPNGKNVLRALKVIKHFHHIRWSPPIDIILKPRNDFHRLFKKRKVFNVGDLKIPVISFRDLMAIKKNRKYFQDLMDIQSLRKHEHLKDWKKKSPETKFNWLADAIQFQRAIKQSKKK